MEWVGLWTSESIPVTAEDALPQPRSGFPSKKTCDFLRKLWEVQLDDDKVKTTYYEGQPPGKCVLCGVETEIPTFATDSWCWPEDYMHYVRDHNIKVPKEFKQYIMDFTLTTSSKKRKREQSAADLRYKYKKDLIGRMETIETDLERLPLGRKNEEVVKFHKKLRKRCRKIMDITYIHMERMDNYNYPRMDIEQLDHCFNALKPVVKGLVDIACAQVDR